MAARKSRGVHLQVDTLDRRDVPSAVTAQLVSASRATNRFGRGSFQEYIHVTNLIAAQAREAGFQQGGGQVRQQISFEEYQAAYGDVV